jgi:hypothetical protein
MARRRAWKKEYEALAESLAGAVLSYERSRDRGKPGCETAFLGYLRQHLNDAAAALDRPPMPPAKSRRWSTS